MDCDVYLLREGPRGWFEDNPNNINKDYFDDYENDIKKIIKEAEGFLLKHSTKKRTIKMKMNILRIYVDPENKCCSIVEYDNGEVECLEGSHYLRCDKGLRDTVSEALDLWKLPLDETTILVERNGGDMIEW